MECLQSRINSFAKAKRVKKGSGTTSIKWPHPTSSNAFQATPATLAEAGFYWNPSHGDPDNVICFMCGKELSGWEEEDDPFQLHFDKCKTCCWAVLRCGLREDFDRHGRFVFTDKSRVPTSKVMEKARLESFSAGDGWIHDQTKGHGANSKKLAKAGFVYAPQHPGDDLATCLYCNVALSGWDVDDDPLEEHRKRVDNSGYSCPFLSPPVTATGAKAASRARSNKPPSRAVQHEDISMPTKVNDGDSGEEGEASESAKSSKSSTRTSSRKSTASGSTKRASTRNTQARSLSRASSRSVCVLKDVMEEDGDQVDGDGDPGDGNGEIEEKAVKALKSTAKAPAKTSRAKKSTTAKAVVPTDSEDSVEEVEAPVTIKKSRSTGRGKASSVAPSTTKNPRSKSAVRSAVEEVDKDEEHSVEEVEEAEPPKTVKKTKSRGASTAKKPAPASRNRAAQESDAGSDMDVDEAWATAPETERKASGKRVPATKSRATKGKKRVVNQSDEEEVDAHVDEAEEEMQKAVKKTSKKAKAPPPITKSKSVSKSKSKAAAKQVVEFEDGEASEVEEVEPAKRIARAASVQSASKVKARDESRVASSSRRLQDVDVESQRATEKDDELQLGQSDYEEDEFGPVLRQPSFNPPIARKISQSLAAAAALSKERPPSRTSVREEEEAHSTKEEAPRPKAKPPSKKALPTKMKIRMSSWQDPGEDVDVTVPLQVPKRNTASVPPPSTEHAKPKPKKEMIVVVSSDDEAEEDVDKATPVVKALRPPPPAKEKLEPSKLQNQVDAPVAQRNPSPPRDDVQDEAMSVDGQPEVDPGMQQQQHQEDVAMRNETDQQSSPQRARVEETPSTPPRARGVVFPSLPIVSSSSIAPASSSSFAAPSSSQQSRPQQTVQPEGPRQSNPLQDPPSVQTQTSQNPSQPSQQQSINTTAEPPFFPPLSKLPFVPLASLTPAEMDMTVEEWVRYQMEMEYDKFKRDGERELARFRKQAEEVRKVIEGL